MISCPGSCECARIYTAGLKKESTREWWWIGDSSDGYEEKVRLVSPLLEIQAYYVHLRALNWPSCSPASTRGIPVAVSRDYDPVNGDKIVFFSSKWTETKSGWWAVQSDGLQFCMPRSSWGCCFVLLLFCCLHYSIIASNLRPSRWYYYM